ncbi:hypothetical protein AQUCO_03300146v1 [Aquilegia coerulea]|uniref:Uncharacterized protein n=1 Tax=Aquilegia coerulea TaxID=218851 RepID=A0A2G5CZP1_AQUCA|nr:hypothetical protein AQUCO_03300146v1 [Aquilegia coerulea]
MAPSFDWFANEKLEGTPVVVKMQNPNWSMLELEDDLHLSGDKGREKNAKQLTWVLLLKAHKAAGCLASIASAMVGLTAAIRRRVSSGRTDADSGIQINRNENPAVKSRFYTCIKFLLWLSVVLLGFEVTAYFKGWHFTTPHLHLQLLLPSPLGVQGLFDIMYSKWVLVRVNYLAHQQQTSQVSFNKYKWVLQLYTTLSYIKREREREINLHKKQRRSILK